MNIIEAFAQIMASPKFKATESGNGRKANLYRKLRSKFTSGTLKDSDIVDLLDDFGYTVTVKKKGS